MFVQVRDVLTYVVLCNIRVILYTRIRMYEYSSVVAKCSQQLSRHGIEPGISNSGRIAATEPQQLARDI